MLSMEMTSIQGVCEKESVRVLSRQHETIMLILQIKNKGEQREETKRRFVAQPHDDLLIASIQYHRSHHTTYADPPYTIHNNNNHQYGRTLLLTVVPLG